MYDYEKINSALCMAIDLKSKLDMYKQIDEWHLISEIINILE